MKTNILTAAGLALTLAATPSLAQQPDCADVRRDLRLLKEAYETDREVNRKATREYIALRNEELNRLRTEIEALRSTGHVSADSLYTEYQLLQGKYNELLGESRDLKARVDSLARRNHYSLGVFTDFDKTGFEVGLRVTDNLTLGIEALFDGNADRSEYMTVRSSRADTMLAGDIYNYTNGSLLSRMHSKVAPGAYADFSFPINGNQASLGLGVFMGSEETTLTPYEQMTHTNPWGEQTQSRIDYGNKFSHRSVKAYPEVRGSYEISDRFGVTAKYIHEQGLKVGAKLKFGTFGDARGNRGSKR